MKRPELIIDVGMHTGEDTDHYLAQGFHVVAIEANAVLVEQVEARHAEAIRDGRLKIVTAAIAEEEGTVRLAVSDEKTDWSTLDPEFIERNESVGTTYRYVDVPAVRFESILEEHGVPHYLKIDIEGLDMLCVRALHAVPERPDYVSVETNATANKSPFASVFDELAHLWTLGYRAFKYVNQNRHPSGFSNDSSGPFGEATPGDWHGIERTLAQAEALRLSHSVGGFGAAHTSAPAKAIGLARTHLLRIGHFDLHARLTPPG